jgi:hypothetical protein
VQYNSSSTTTTIDLFSDVGVGPNEICMEAQLGRKRMHVGTREKHFPCSRDEKDAKSWCLTK